MKRTQTPQTRPQPADQAARAPAAPDPDGGSRPGDGSRRSYRSPRLACHGRLAEVTRFGGSQILDSGGGLGQQL